MLVLNNKKRFKLQNQPKLLLNLDWLSFTALDCLKVEMFNQNNQFEYKDYVFEIQEFGKTANFNNKVFAYRDGQQIATILFESSHPTILKGRCQIKIDNAILYDKDCQQIIKDLIFALDLRNIKLSRVDLALDGSYLHDFINYYQYKNDKKNIFRIKDRDNIAHPVSSRSQRLNHDFDTFTIGSYGNKDTKTKKSCKFIRYYNKTKEIKEKSNKSYILEYFEKNDFEMSIDTYRFEIELTSRFLISVKGITLDKLFEFEYLEKLFNTALKNTFEFRLKQKDSNITRMDKIQLFKDLTKGVLDKVKKVIEETAYAIKVFVKKAFTELLIGRYAQKSYEKIILNENRKRLIDDYDLGDWWKKNVDRFTDEITKKAKTKGLTLNYTNML
ncbi:MAG: hypothetical protein ACK5B9_00810 [Flavobacteriia bacterium]|jgi:hypothetical protein